MKVRKRQELRDVVYRFPFLIGANFGMSRTGVDPEPDDADDGTATKVKTAGTTYGAFLINSLLLLFFPCISHLQMISRILSLDLIFRRATT